MNVYEVKGRPVPWRRPGRAGTKYYDTQLEEKKKIQAQITSTLKDLPLYSEPIRVIFEFNMEIPTSWSKERKKMMEHHPHISRPDLDNLAKLIGDTFNKILWSDDSIIYELQLKKFYSLDPKTVIYIEPHIREGFYPLPI